MMRAGTHVLAKTRIAWGLLLCLETLCQISLKMAGKITGAFDFSAHAFAHALGTPWLWLAIACYVGAFGAWMTILRESTLSAAFTTSALVFVAVMLSSWLIFGESLGLMQWFGSIVIVCGILMLGSEDADAGIAPTPPSIAGSDGA
ncbi:MAG: EamA family transporter [Rudaea sp.]